jgi:uncharacterized protein YkwD
MIGTLAPRALRALLPAAAIAAGLSLLPGCGAMLGSGLVTGSEGASYSAASYMNEARTSNGLSPASPDSRLEAAALEQARYMAAAGEMTHTTGIGRDFASRKNDNEIKGTAAENVAYGATNVARVMEMWMDSAPHRRNMLDPRFKHFGVASATDGEGRRYWAMVLGE